MSVESPRKVTLVGILNVTPDSFSDGGLVTSPEIALARAKRLIAEGATVLDIGGESTRPGAVPVDESTELRRVVPVVERIAAMLRAAHIPCRISVDTYRPNVAYQSILAGASFINDVRAATEPGMLELLRQYSGDCDDPTSSDFWNPVTRKIDICLMHGYVKPSEASFPKGCSSPESPSNDRLCQAIPREDIVAQVQDFLRSRVDMFVREGIKRSRIVLDPGIGFGKTAEQNREVLRRLRELRTQGVRILVGVSRKRFLRDFLPPQLPETIRTGGSIGVALAILPWVDMLRVHDVAATYQAIQAYCATGGW